MHLVWCNYDVKKITKLYVTLVHCSKAWERWAVRVQSDLSTLSSATFVCTCTKIFLIDAIYCGVVRLCFPLSNRVVVNI